jgi:hypothetical protein
MPYFGKWDGGFVVEEIDGGGATRDHERESLNGYLMLYATGSKFALHLEGEQQTIDVSGTWKIVGKQIQTQTTKLEIDDQGGEDFRDPNKKYIPSDAVRAALGRSIGFQLSPDQKRLASSTERIGNLVGTYRFKRG